jgi:DNA-binding response OmpR family regulator
MSPSACCLTASAEVAGFLKTRLKGFRLKFYASAAAFLSAPRKGLVIIDSALPDMSGRDVAAVLRGDPRTAGTLIVQLGAAPYSPAAAALCLDQGADEYFIFPPDPLVFRARLLNLLGRAGLRRSRDTAPREFSFGTLTVSPEARTARVAGRRLALTALEFDLLLFFLRNEGRVASRGVLLEKVWRDGTEAGPRSVDKRVEALRAKLGRAFGARIRTVFGLGYIFKLGKQ